jgi:hypothetical protein
MPSNVLIWYTAFSSMPAWIQEITLVMLYEQLMMELRVSTLQSKHEAVLLLNLIWGSWVRKLHLIWSISRPIRSREEQHG